MITANNTVRLIDFGLAVSSHTRKDLKEVAGTPYYMAPEVIQGAYGKQSDLWSLGVILYTLVSGYLPFQGDSQAIVFQKIVTLNYHFDHKEFKAISPDCIDLIRKLLVLNPEHRLTG